MSPALVNIFGFAAFVTNVWGNLLLARKSTRGWHLRIVSIVLWGVYGVAAASWPNIVNAATFFLINLYGLWKWRQEERRGRLP